MNEESVERLFAEGAVQVAGLRKEFGIPRATAYELMAAGKLPFSLVGGRRYVPRAAVVALLAGGVGGAAATAGAK